MISMSALLPWPFVDDGGGQQPLSFAVVVGTVFLGTTGVCLAALFRGDNNMDNDKAGDGEKKKEEEVAVGEYTEEKTKLATAATTSGRGVSQSTQTALGTAVLIISVLSWFVLPMKRGVASASPARWSYIIDGETFPSPVGLFTGIFAVFVGQVITLVYHFTYRRCATPPRIQIGNSEEGQEEWEEGGAASAPQPQPRPFSWKGLASHLSQPEGFVLLSSYLSLTWMLRLMPDSYYSFGPEGVCWCHVLQQLLLTDFVQTFMHLLEHRLALGKWNLYRVSHKPHHKFLDPTIFEAFDGSFLDTVLMILVPLYTTARVIHCNVWSYMVFGSLYANYLCLIHSDYAHPWDPLVRKAGVNTAADHHVHHRLFLFNFGHIFTFWDRLLGTYRDPRMCKGFRKDKL